MRLLLDTHALVWLADGSDELATPARELIDTAARSSGLAVSAISFWELAMLAERSRISLSKPIADWRSEVLDAPGIIEITVTGDIGIEAALLPGDIHGDPADRILAATARLHECRLATRDRRLLDYGEQGHVATAKI